MDTICTFQSNDPALEALWTHGVEAFLRVDPSNMAYLAQDAASFPVYVKLCLILTAEITQVEEMLSSMASYLANQMACGDREAVLPSYAYPEALLAYAEYVAEWERIRPFYDAASSLVKQAEEIGAHTPLLDAHRIGAKLHLQKVAYLCNLPYERAVLGAEIGAFHTANYDAKQGVYTPFSLNYLTAHYGFVSDDGEDTVREYLMEHSFEVEKVDRTYLYGALCHLEAYDALLSAVLEAGTPQEYSAPSHLAGFLALITMLCGVDVPMLAKGIRCMQVSLPEHLAFRMILASPDGPIYYDYGELLFDEFSI